MQVKPLDRPVHYYYIGGPSTAVSTEYLNPPAKVFGTFRLVIPTRPTQAVVGTTAIAASVCTDSAQRRRGVATVQNHGGAAVFPTWLLFAVCSREGFFEVRFVSSRVLPNPGLDLRARAC